MTSVKRSDMEEYLTAVELHLIRDFSCRLLLIGTRRYQGAQPNPLWKVEQLRHIFNEIQGNDNIVPKSLELLL